MKYTSEQAEQMAEIADSYYTLCVLSDRLYLSTTDNLREKIENLELLYKEFEKRTPPEILVCLESSLETRVKEPLIRAKRRNVLRGEEELLEKFK